MDVVFVLDTSSSLYTFGDKLGDGSPDKCDNDHIQCAHFETMKDFVVEFMDQLQIGANESRVGVLEFAQVVDSMIRRRMSV
jgi:hypothetical protein